ncbi:MAG: hypothetical protein LJE93_01100 [Acidobacteria bacterium]|jgi:anti-anti-sigma regulatory factor|nr:hypothetical protein [Acidobacteriota bacterium]
MDTTTLQVTATTPSSRRLLVAVEGYLDERGGAALARETQATRGPESTRIRIDLGNVCLFNCFGARRLITLVSDLEHQGHEVELVGVRPPLQRVLDLRA